MKQYQNNDKENKDRITIQQKKTAHPGGVFLMRINLTTMLNDMYPKFV